jgi:hypothetical protein
MRQDDQREQHDGTHSDQVGSAPVSRLLDGTRASQSHPEFPPGVAYPMRVIAVIQSEFAAKVSFDMEEDYDFYDDGYWAHFVAQPFTWDRFYRWWIERRFLAPRDVRKR